MKKFHAIKQVLSVIDQGYPNNLDEEWLQDEKLFNLCIAFAIKNGLYYELILKLKELDKDLPYLSTTRWSEEESNASKFRETVNFLNELCYENKINYIIIKIFYIHRHVPNDIDTFISGSQRGRFISLLQTNGMKPLHSSLAETKLIGNYMKTDIYTEISYLGKKFLSSEFLWKSKDKSQFLNVEYPSLNANADFLMLIPHYLFGHRRITLLDFMHIKYLMENIDKQKCHKYASDNGWGRMFDLAYDHFQTLRHRLYDRGESIKFPYVFDHSFILRCISSVDDLNIGLYRKMFLYLSFILGTLTYSLEGTWIYNVIKSVAPARNFINTISASINANRGDKKSSNELSDSK
jgi:hypothetical protein